MFGLGEAMLGFLRRQVGLRTDAADATGSLHAKLAHMTATLPERLAYASNTLRVSADTQRAVTDVSSYTLVKEVQMNVAGYIRLSWEGNRSTLHANNRFAICVNNVVTIDDINPGSQSPSFTTLTYDIPVRAGDVIGLLAKTADDATVTVRNFRIYYDVGNSPVVGLD